jgi:type II secretory pathway pseudopilin PulG
MATTLLVAAIVGGVVAAAAAGYGAYAANEAQQQQAAAAKRSMRMQEEAERNAGEARRRQVLYDAEKKRQSMASREAGAGVQIGEGSLLEDEQQFARDAQYSAEMAAYPHAIAGDMDSYKARVFGWQKDYAASQEATGITLATASSAASSYGSYARSRPSSVQPATTENLNT